MRVQKLIVVDRPVRPIKRVRSLCATVVGQPGSDGDTSAREDYRFSGVSGAATVFVA
jgi:hypothetical protein